VSKLEELEKRLQHEPDSLGLRVLLASALHDAGRRDDSIELYRSVAIAYRDQGRTQQAIAVCRSLLAIAPDDQPSQRLLAQLLANRSTPPRLPRAPLPAPAAAEASAPFHPIVDDGADPTRSSSADVTPLPAPLPYHIADPTGSIPVVSPAELPPVLPGELPLFPEIAGIADAARQISASLISAQPPDLDDLSGELETRRMPRITDDDLLKISGPPPVVKTGQIGVPRVPDLPELAEPPEVQDLPEPGDDEPTLLPPIYPIDAIDAMSDDGVVDDETTRPRDLPFRARPPSIAPPTTATGPLAGAFFVLVPPRNRASVLHRFRRRLAASGTTVIEHGEIGHGLVIVVRGRLEIHARRSDGVVVVVGAIAAGEYIGEASLLTRTAAPATVVAAVDSEIMVLAESDFYEVTGAFPALWIELKRVAERRAREHALRLRG
jgi:hypothetical protein